MTCEIVCDIGSQLTAVSGELVPSRRARKASQMLGIRAALEIIAAQIQA